jgi:mRNA-degrading endonuclease RelE of RelBE toxin-antitoxin system
MSLTVVVQETALRELARIRSGDRPAFTAIRQALAALADEPRPGPGGRLGGSGIYRLHLSGVRVLYEVDEGAATVYVVNGARVPRIADAVNPFRRQWPRTGAGPEGRGGPERHEIQDQAVRTRWIPGFMLFRRRTGRGSPGREGEWGHAPGPFGINHRSRGLGAPSAGAVAEAGGQRGEHLEYAHLTGYGRKI